MFENRSELGWLLLKKALHLCVSIVLGPIQGVSTLLRVTVGIPCHIQPSCVDTPSRILKSNCVYLQCLTIRFQIEKQKKKIPFSLQKYRKLATLCLCFYRVQNDRFSPEQPWVLQPALSSVFLLCSWILYHLVLGLFFHLC